MIADIDDLSAPGVRVMGVSNKFREILRLNSIGVIQATFVCVLHIDLTHFGLHFQAL